MIPPKSDARSTPNRSRPRKPRRPGTSPWPAVLLGAALLLTGVLAYQAVDAARSHRAAAERALSDYAAFAASEFGQRAQRTLETAMITAQYYPVAGLEGQPASAPLGTAAAYADTVHSQDYWCACLAGVTSFFVLDARTGAADWTGDLPADVRRWVAAEAMAHADSIARGPRRDDVSLYGEAEGREGAGKYQLRVAQSVAAVRLFQGRPHALIWTVVFDRDDRPRAVYGLAGDPAVMGAPVFRRVAERRPLLPPSVTGGLPNDSVLAIFVAAPGGRILWTSSGEGEGGGVAEARGAFAAADTFRGAFAGMTVRVALRPDAAGRLVIGGLPASRLPLVLGVLALAAALGVVAILQVRRQNELARMRADFVSGVSHELRTPLTQIRMFAELLAGGRLRGEEERQRSARLIDQEARRLSWLVENVLDFSRAERGAARVSPEPTDAAALVREVLDAFAPVARSKSVHVRTVLDEGVTASVDRGAVRQVLLNFLDNAVKYGPAGQTVTVGAVRAGERVRIFVEDEGIGVPAADRRRVWEPYTRLSREAERVTGGSGIGLAVVCDLVRLHGGSAWVEDAASGAGARFVAELPLRAESSGGIASSDSSASFESPASSDSSASSDVPSDRRADDDRALDDSSDADRSASDARSAGAAGGRG